MFAFGCLYMQPIVALESVLISVNTGLLLGISSHMNLVGCKLLASVCLIFMRWEVARARIKDLCKGGI
jgi:hypothetical protein